MKELSDKEIISILENKFEEYEAALKETKRLNGELHKVNRMLKESEAMKSHFISNVANEMINPFTSILMMSKKIMEADTENINRIKSMAKQVHNEAFVLDFQLKNIFCAASLEAGESSLEISNVKISDLLTELINEYRSQIFEKEIEIVFDANNDEPVFQTDILKLKLIISNLLSNAINFSSVRSKIEIGLKATKDDFVLSIKDYGIGIESSKQKEIFDRFKKIDPSINTLNKGNGLGLSVSKALVELLNGKIELQSNSGDGTKITLICPKLEIPNADLDEKAGDQLFMEDGIIF